MPRFCGVINCSNRGGRDKKSFFRLPAILTRGKAEKIELSTKRRQAWLNAIKRSDMNEVKKKHLLICEDHFFSGKPADIMDTNNIDWVPSKNLGYHKNISSTAPERYERLQTRNSRNRSKVFGNPSDLTDPSQPEDPTDPSQLEDLTDPREPEAMNFPVLNIENECQTISVSTQTTLTMGDMENMVRSIDDFVEENSNLKKKLHNLQIDENMFETSIDKCLYYTGLPSFQCLMIVFELVSPNITCSSMSLLTKFQQFVLTLMKLRLNFDFCDLAYRFNVSSMTASRVFYSCLYTMAQKLSPFILWPDRDSLRCKLPEVFKNTFGNQVTVIIDCFEIQVEKPSNLLAATQMWSNYKQRFTQKFLIGICPQGVISFISKAWGGRTSDKYITENSGFLEKLVPGDLVLADRGFTIKDSVNLYCARVITPSFMKGRKQLCALEIEETRKLASIRIHVERVIGVLRQKYQILDGVMPITLISKMYCDESSVVDNILKVCAALVNICPSVVPFD